MSACLRELCTLYIYFAIETSRYEAVKLLIESPFVNLEHCNALYIAVNTSDDSMVRLLLADNSVCVNGVGLGCPLTLAMRLGHTHIVETLTQRDATEVADPHRHLLDKMPINILGWKSEAMKHSDKDNLF